MSQAVIDLIGDHLQQNMPVALAAAGALEVIKRIFRQPPPPPPPPAVVFVVAP